MLKRIGVAVVSFAPFAAFAAVPADVQTALTDMKADTMTVAGAFVVLAILVAALMWMRKPAK